MSVGNFEGLDTATGVSSIILLACPQIYVSDFSEEFKQWNVSFWNFCQVFISPTQSQILQMLPWNMHQTISA